MESKAIWSPVKFNPDWNRADTHKFDILYPSWEKRRTELLKNPEQYNRFIDQIKRKQAIDTGIIESMYDLKKGITETFIKEGFVDSYLRHGDTDISPNLLMSYLKDNYDAIDFVFDFVKNNRSLSVSYIKELHALITMHQDYTEAIDQFGAHGKAKLIRGQFKKNPNNPLRDGVVYRYCPPEQVESEMDNLIGIFNNELTESHVLVRAAFLHHAFVQIHPFQDGNGRLARLLASFVLIKEGLFPLTIDRDDRARYIDALEKADNREYQPIIDIFATNQVYSIEKALNWKITVDTDRYDNVVDLFKMKLSDYKDTEAERQNKKIAGNMARIFDRIKIEMDRFTHDLKAKLDNDAEIVVLFSSVDADDSHYYTGQIMKYANQYGYYVNTSLQRHWCSMYVSIDEIKKYRLTISLHHFGYDNGTFAIGAFLSKRVFDKTNTGNQNEIQGEYIDIPFDIPPLSMSSDIDISEMTFSIKQQVELSVMACIAYIANELT